MIAKVLLLLLLPAGASLAQQPDSLEVPLPPHTTVTILANIEGAYVFLNGDSVGTTPLLNYASTPGFYHLRIVSPDVESWLSDPILDSLTIEEGTTREFSYTFERKVLIVTTPSGAEVTVKDSVLGTTPLVLKTEHPSLKLRRPGFEETTIDLASAKQGIITAQLKRQWQHDSDETALNDETGEGTGSLRLYITGATTIVAGAASAYFKVRADNLYGQYIRNGDPAQLSEVNRLDTAAGIALAATQISLGLFTYFVLSE
ncbi:MAG: PEGA domain-containing protein [Bacteroidetes bacterium]|nr:PEGA domain-containing protein [Bacteroidota bacterium]MCW5896614.1 PEGA domain-containing protein [Bacteroidota bacterium]